MAFHTGNSLRWGFQWKKRSVGIIKLEFDIICDLFLNRVKSQQFIYISQKSTNLTSYCRTYIILSFELLSEGSGNVCTHVN